MSANRKKKLREREARFRKLKQRQRTVERTSRTNNDIQSEMDYIVERASEHDARCVTLGSLTFFSTETGDAWMLDSDDGLAVCLARDGDPLPARLVESGDKIGIEWNFTYSIDGDCFTTTEQATGRTRSIIGYPTNAIVTAIEKSKKSWG